MDLNETNLHYKFGLPLAQASCLAEHSQEITKIKLKK